MMTCLLGLFGTVKAQETITIGERTSNTNLLPTDCYYEYSFTQQIYTASEIGTGAGTITKIAFNQESANTYTRNLTIYMLNTDKETFDSNKDLVEVTESDIVFNGDITTTKNMSWLEIELDNEFNYEGENMTVCGIRPVRDAHVGDYTFLVVKGSYLRTGALILWIECDHPFYKADPEGFLRQVDFYGPDGTSLMPLRGNRHIDGNTAIYEVFNESIEIVPITLVADYGGKGFTLTIEPEVIP